MVLAGSLLWTVSANCGQEEDLGRLDEAAAARVKAESVCTYEATPLPVVMRMLELAQVRPNETVYDLGSGDGRILIMAAQKFGAKGLGVELDPRRARQSLQTIEKLDLSFQIQIVEDDFLKQDLSRADVVTMYLNPWALYNLRPHLEKFLHEGMRIVTCVDEMPGWKATAAITAVGDNKRSYKLYLSVISRQSDWVSFSKFVRTP